MSNQQSPETETRGSHSSPPTGSTIGYQVIKDCYSGKKIGEHVVWTDRAAADYDRERKSETLGDFEEVRMIEVKCTPLTDTKADCDGRVCTINRTTRTDMVRAHALTKLNAEERAALGLSNDGTERLPRE